MNEASGEGEASTSGSSQASSIKEPEKNDKKMAESEKKKLDGKGKDGSREAQARPQSSRQRRDQKPKDSKRKPQEIAKGASGDDDKDVISWLNKKITKQGGKDTKPSSNPSQANSQTDKNSTKVENWRDRDAQRKPRTGSPSTKYNRKTVDKGRKEVAARPENWRSSNDAPKGEIESSSRKGYRKGGWDKQGKDEKFKPNPSLDIEKKKPFNSDNMKGRKGNWKEVDKSVGVINPSRNGAQSSDVIKIGANVNVIDGKYVSKNRQREQQDTMQTEQNNSNMQSSFVNSQNTQSLNNIPHEPQVFVYGGLHVYNMPYTDQQYYPTGQQWYHYGNQEHHYEQYQNLDYNYDQQYQEVNQQYFKSDQKINGNKVPSKVTTSEEFSKKVKVQRINVVIDPNHSIQASVLTEQLLNESYECMVCCDKIRCHASVWNCTNCYHVFHLRCIRKWANSPAALIEGRK